MNSIGSRFLVANHSIAWPSPAPYHNCLTRSIETVASPAERSSRGTPVLAFAAATWPSIVCIPDLLRLCKARTRAFFGVPWRQPVSGSSLFGPAYMAGGIAYFTSYPPFPSTQLDILLSSFFPIYHTLLPCLTVYCLSLSCTPTHSFNTPSYPPTFYVLCPSFDNPRCLDSLDQRLNHHRQILTSSHSLNITLRPKNTRK